MELSSFFFTFSHNIKLYHWQTPIYSRHIASDTLFTTLATLMDKLMEVYQGRYGRVKTPKQFTLSVSSCDDKEIIKYLELTSSILQKLGTRDDVLHSEIKASDTDMLNIRDELVGAINQTVYLFQFK